MSEQNRKTVCETIEGITPDDLRIRERPWLGNMITLQGDRWSLNGPQLRVARGRGIIEKLPKITDDEVDDRNKGDSR